MGHLSNPSNPFDHIHDHDPTRPDDEIKSHALDHYVQQIRETAVSSGSEVVRKALGAVLKPEALVEPVRIEALIAAVERQLLASRGLGPAHHLEHERLAVTAPTKRLFDDDVLDYTPDGAAKVQIGEQVERGRPDDLAIHLGDQQVIVGARLQLGQHPPLAIP